jgi:hypothetical protein
VSSSDGRSSEPAGTLDAARAAHERDVVELAVERAMDKARRTHGRLGDGPTPGRTLDGWPVQGDDPAQGDDWVGDAVHAHDTPPPVITGEG